jgi:hypothetical protein
MLRSSTARLGCAVAVLVAICTGGVASGEGEPPAFFDPLIAIAPGISREVDALIDHVRGPSERHTLTSLRLQYPLLPQLQLSLEAPAAFRDPDSAPSTAGLGDLLLSGQAMLWVPQGWPAELDVGLELAVPSGRAAVRAGSTAVRPFLAAGTKLGPVDVIGNVSYQWVTGGPIEGTETLQAILAVGYASRPLTPFVEVVLLEPVRGVADTRPQVGALAGVEIYLSDAISLSIGVELGLGPSRPFDQRVLGFFKWQF